MVRKHVASFLATQLGLTTLGDHIFGYSGVIGVTNAEKTLILGNAEKTLILGNTGKYYAVTEVQFLSNMNSGDDYVAKIYLNNVATHEFIISATHDSAPYGYFPINVIIPPNTQIKITLDNVTDTSSNNWDVQLTGRIYNA